MKRALALLPVLVLLGCAKPAEQAPIASKPSPPLSSTAGGGDTIAPVGSGALGGAAPITGSDSVEGAGMGGIGQVAKDKARKAAASAGTPAGSQTTAGDDTN